MDKDMGQNKDQDMDQDKDYLADQESDAAVAEALRLQHEAMVEAEQMQQAAAEAAADPATRQELIGQSNLIYGGLAGAGLVVVQPFLTAPSLDPSAMVCVIAFAVAIPLLAALLLVNRQEAFRKSESPSRLVLVAKSIAQSAAFVGIAAAFWHISWVAGVVFLVIAAFALGVQSAGYTRLEYDAKFRPRFGHDKDAPAAGTPEA